MFKTECLETDVLVLGGGLAGYRAAIAARERGAAVMIAYRARGASPYVIGFNAPLGHADERDMPQIFFDDMIRGGYGLNDRRLAHVLAHESIDAYQSLAEMGVPFACGNELTADGQRKALQRHLSGNTYPRSVYVPEGTGRAILEALIAKSHRDGIHTIAGHKIVQLLRSDEEVIGAVLWKPTTQTLLVVKARAVVVAMGGIGQLYADSTYPVDVAADAFGMTFDAGARLIDMEFVQFEPVVTVWPAECRGMEMPTAMLGDGAQLRNALGERFMLRYNPPLGERGIEKAKMSLCIQQELDAGRGFPEGGVLFDTTLLTPEKLESYVSHCKRLRAAGVDPAVRPPIVAPAAHSTMGGVFIDEQGWSGIPGLYVGGEAAGGVHGASRIAGNGCSDTLVFGAVAGRGAAQGMLAHHGGRHEAAVQQVLTRLDGLRGGVAGGAPEIKNAIRGLVSQAAGIWRSGASLLEGLDALEVISERLDAATGPQLADIIALLEARHMVVTARMILGASLTRTESRGAHQRTDFPQRDDSAWLHHISFKKGADGTLVEELIPIR